MTRVVDPATLGEPRRERAARMLDRHVHSPVRVTPEYQRRWTIDAMLAFADSERGR